jgi:hypothetical protein
MDEDQRNARIFGVLFIITFLTSIPAYALFQPVLDDPAGYIAGGGKDNQIYLGVLLELLLIIANIGTAVVLYPIARRQPEPGGRIGRRARAGRWTSTAVPRVPGSRSRRRRSPRPSCSDGSRTRRCRPSGRKLKVSSPTG